MKKTALLTGIIATFTFLLFSCDKEPEPIYKYDPKVVTYDNASKLSDFLRKNETKFQVFTVDANAGVTVTSAKGIKYTVEPYSLVDNFGMPVTGNIQLSIKEIVDISDMILSNKPTALPKGGMLESFGEFFVKAQQNGKNLRQRIDSNVVRNAIKIAFNNRSKVTTPMPIWDADTSLTYTQNGYNHENVYATKTTQIPLPKGADWGAVPGAMAQTDPDTIRFKLPDLFKWSNCDVISNYGGTNTTVLCYFENHFNKETITTQSYMGMQTSMCFFKPENRNTVIKLYNSIFDAPVGKEGFLSYQNSMPIGVKGTFFVCTIENEKFYSQSKSVTIDAPVGGKNYTPIAFQLTEVTEAELLNQLKALNQ